MLKIAIVDDEKTNRDYLSENVHKFFDDKNVDIDISFFENGISFSDKYNCDYDLIFMDISMPGENGMDVCEKIRKIDNSVMIIFITSLAQYAVRGYKVNAFDFIVKPFDYYDLNLTLLRALPILSSKKESIVISTNEREKVKILLDDLLYIEVSDHILLFHTENGIFKNYDTLKTYEEKLESKSFSLCNRCYLVNLKNVKRIQQNTVLVGEDELLISRPRKKDFITALNKFISSGR